MFGGQPQRLANPALHPEPVGDLAAGSGVPGKRGVVVADQVHDAGIGSSRQPPQRPPEQDGIGSIKDPMQRAEVGLPPGGRAVRPGRACPGRRLRLQQVEDVTAEDENDRSRMPGE